MQKLSPVNLRSAVAGLAVAAPVPWWRVGVMWLVVGGLGADCGWLDDGRGGIAALHGHVRRAVCGTHQRLRPLRHRFSRGPLDWLHRGRRYRSQQRGRTGPWRGGRPGLAANLQQCPGPRLGFVSRAWAWCWVRAGP